MSPRPPASYTPGLTARARSDGQTGWKRMAMASLLGLLDGRLRPEDYDGLSLMPSTPATPHFRTRRLALASHSP